MPAQTKLPQRSSGLPSGSSDVLETMLHFGSNSARAEALFGTQTGQESSPSSIGDDPAWLASWMQDGPEWHAGDVAGPIDALPSLDRMPASGSGAFPGVPGLSAPHLAGPTPSVDSPVPTTANRGAGPTVTPTPSGTASTPSPSVTDLLLKGHKGSWKAGATRQVWQHSQQFGGHTTARVSALEAAANAEAHSKVGITGARGEAEASAALKLASGEVVGQHDLIRANDDVLGVDGKLDAGAEVQVSGKAAGVADLSGVAAAAELDAFAGARAGAEIGGTVSWDRKDDYGPMLADYFDNIPGNADDWLLDKVPASLWTQMGRLVFGTGRTDLAKAGVGVDARAGAGANARAAVAARKGMVGAEAELGAAVGVGGGLKGNVGLNPLDLVRRGAAASIGLTNRVFGMAESGIKAVRDWFGPRR